MGLGPVIWGSTARPSPAPTAPCYISLSFLVRVHSFILQAVHLAFLLLLQLLLRAAKFTRLKHLLHSDGLGTVLERFRDFSNARYARLKCLLESAGLGTFVAEAEKSTVFNAFNDFNVHADLSLPPPLLPARHVSDSERLTIVLDLDETLVCAYNSAGLPATVHQAAVKGGIQWFPLECNSPDLPTNGSPDQSHVTVYERPGLREFLRQASQLGEVVLFTAGLEGYARPLVDRIDPEGCISVRLYRQATVNCGSQEHVKDLTRLGRDMRRTVLVDNNPFSFLMQPTNGVPCVAFYGTEGEDNQLLDVLLPLLQQLSRQPDVRLLLAQKYRMPLWFRSKGVHVHASDRRC